MAVPYTLGELGSHLFGGAMHVAPALDAFARGKP